MYNFKKEMHARMPAGTPEIPINIHQEIIRIEAIQCGDLIFNKFGIESRDVVPSMIKLGLLNDEEIREVIQGYHSMFEGFLRQKAFEADQNVQRQKMAVEAKMKEDMEKDEKKTEPKEEVEVKEEEVVVKEEKAEI